MLRNIIYVTHAEKGPSGGAKIIYRHSEIINDMKNFSSEVLHLRKKRFSKLKISINKRLKLNKNDESGWQFNQIEGVKNFSYSWLQHKIRIRSNKFKGQVLTELKKFVFPLIIERKIKCFVDSVFKFKDVIKAHQRIDEGKHIGKIILNP